jgi:hypothetical protein
MKPATLLFAFLTVSGCAHPNVPVVISQIPEGIDCLETPPGLDRQCYWRLRATFEQVVSNAIGAHLHAPPAGWLGHFALLDAGLLLRPDVDLRRATDAQLVYEFVLTDPRGRQAVKLAERLTWRDLDHRTARFANAIALVGERIGAAVDRYRE